MIRLLLISLVLSSVTSKIFEIEADIEPLEGGSDEKTEDDNLLKNIVVQETKGDGWSRWQMVRKWVTRDMGDMGGLSLTDKVVGGEMWKKKSATPPRHDLNVTTGVAGHGVFCPCKVTVLSSLGDAANYQPLALGTYKYYQTYNSLPAYHGPNNLRIYWTPAGGWLVSSKLGAAAGYIHNAGDGGRSCPYMLPQGWMFYSQVHNMWYTDPTLVFRCVP